MNAPMLSLRLAVVVPSARREGGGDVWLDQLLRHLPSPETRPLVVFEEEGELERSALRNGWHTSVLPRENGVAGNDVSALAAPLARVLAAHQPDVTVFWSPRAQLYGAQAHQLAGRPGRTAWVQHVLPSTFWLHKDASMLPTDLVICVSTAVQNRQRELYPQHATCVVHPGLQAPRRSFSRAAARTHLGCVTSLPVIGVVGRVEPWKGQDIAIGMLSELAARDVDAHLILLGRRPSPTWPEFSVDVDRLIDEHDLSHRVAFAGHLRDVPAVLPALDVLVCASREEGFGLAVVEAMAAGVPVVATRCGGPEDIIEDGLTGLLVPAEDPAALAAAVWRVLLHPGVTNGLTSRARRAWRERFTAVHSAEALRTALADLAASPCLCAVQDAVAGEHKGDQPEELEEPGSLDS